MRGLRLAPVVRVALAPVVRVALTPVVRIARRQQQRPDAVLGFGLDRAKILVAQAPAPARASRHAGAVAEGLQFHSYLTSGRLRSRKWIFPAITQKPANLIVRTPSWVI